MGSLITGKAAKEAAIDGALLLASAVECTLGPKGKNVVLYEDGEAYVTKDGISIAKKVTGRDEYEEAGVQILRQASLKTAEEAGDGTTTSIVLAKALLDLSTSEDVKSNLPDLFKGMDIALSNFNEVLPFYTKEVGYNYDQLKFIATTSANNDEKIGELVAKAFVKAGPNGFVTLDKELHGHTYTEESNGLMLDRGCFDNAFIMDRIKQITTYENPYIIFYKGKVDNIKDLQVNNILNGLGPCGVAVIATDFSSTTISSMIANTYKGNVKFLPIMAEGMAESKLKVIEDLIAVTGSTALTDKISYGTLKSITASMNNVILEPIDNRNIKPLNDLIAQYKNNVEKFPENAEYFKKRLAKLTGKLYIIKAGGATEVEAKELRDRIEDAICAVQAAIDEGIVDGGGMTYYRIARILESGAYRPLEADYLKGYDIVVKALEYPLKRLCLNADLEYNDIVKEVTSQIGYNFNTFSYEDLNQTGVQDPKKVVKLALTNAISVVKALLTIDCIII